MLCETPLFKEATCAKSTERVHRCIFQIMFPFKYRANLDMANFDIIVYVIQHWMCVYMGFKTIAEACLRGAMALEKPHL